MNNNTKNSANSPEKPLAEEQNPPLSTDENPTKTLQNTLENLLN